MRKKLFTLLLVIVAGIGLTFAEVYSGSCGNNLTWSLNTEDSTLTISGTGAMANYSSSSTSSAPWYSYLSSITSIVINEGVTSIGNYAFRNCSSLTSVTIPNSVTSIGDMAFYSCGLISVSIPNSVTSIGSGAFYNCSSLTSVTIPNSVTSIGSSAFGNVPNIVYNGTATGSPWGAKSINGYVDGYLVYSDATKTTLLACFASAEGDIVIPSSVTSIGNSAFSYCNNLTSVTIPQSVISITPNAFILCSSLTAINVTIDNPNYCSVDGILFNKEKTTLIHCNHPLICIL